MNTPTTRRRPATAKPIANRSTGAVPRIVAPRDAKLIARANRWRDSYNPLRALTMARVVSLLEEGERGNFADLQWTYRSIEKRNATCRALILRRASALLKLDWDIKVPDELPAGATPAMADQQIKTLRSWYERVDNLRGAIRALALAEFRGFAHLQIQSPDRDQAGIEAAREGVICLKPIHQWHWVRDGIEGQWGFNAEASAMSWASVPEDQRVDPESWGLIIREVAMPIDELALIGFVRKSMSQKDWDAFVEIYGIPGGVVIMPPGVPEGKETEYQDAALAVAEGGSGSLPNGSSYEPNDAPGGTNPFRDHIEYQDQELVLAGTGGKLTMLTAAGSGTLAGGAHQDAFDEIAEGEAAEISEIMQQQFDQRILRLVHPGQPRLAYWQLASEPDENTDALVERAAKLHGMGFVIDREELEEKVGLKLEEEDDGAAPAPGADPEPNPPAPGRPAPPPDPEDDEDPAQIRNRDSTPGPTRKEDPLEARARRQLTDALRADLAPFRRRLEALQRISDPEIRKARAEALLAEWEGLAADVQADPETAQALARLQGAALVDGLTGPRDPAPSR